MFRSLRWRLTVWFVVLTTVVYAASAAFGTYIFQGALTSIIEDEKEALMAEIEPAIDLVGDVPTLREWARTRLFEPFKFLPTIQLYDKSGTMLEHYGPPGIAQLYKDGGELSFNHHIIRIYSEPLDVDNKLVGYLQMELNMRSRDRAFGTYLNTLTNVAPYLIVALGLAGYFFAALAARPTEQGVLILRRFMSDAGHELGTPIAIIQANAEAMELDLPPDDESLKSKLGIITRSTDRLGNLVQDLSLLSKMESPEVQQRKANIDLDKLVHSVTEEVDALFQAKDIVLTTKKMEHAPIFGDSDSLKRMTMNLFQNALRYTDNRGEVSVAVEVVGRQARLTISDTGMGIPEESLPKIFDRFYRVEKSRTRAAGGAGLGLSIVKAIVDVHRGKIEVTSKVGTGTTFTVLIPLKYPAV